MPIYEYCCEDCSHIFEEWQSGFEEKQFPCPLCEGTAKRIVSQTSFVLKGSGWYVTDYGNKHASSKPSGKENASKENKDKDTKTTKTEPSNTTTKPKKADNAAAPPSS